MSAASVSEHLKVLRKTGLAVVERRGKFWYYKTNVAFLTEILADLEDELLNDGKNDGA